MKYLVILLSISIFLGTANADSDPDDDYQKFPLGDSYIYADSKHITDISLIWSETLPSGTITFDKKLESDISIMIPKNIPRMMNLDFGTSMAVFYPDTSVVQIKESEPDCFYHLRIPVNDADTISIDTISVASGRWEPVKIDDPKCEHVYKRYSEKYELRSQVSQSPIPPLKQIQNGTALFNVKCDDSKILAYKYDNMHVACVSEETHSKLISRGWALLRFAMPDENPSHVLCNRYDGKWHPKYFGCRDVADTQCSLMGGVFVDNLRICYDGICPEKLYSLCVTNMNLDILYPYETKEQYDDRCRQSETIRGPGPGPIECDSVLIECVSECGNDDIWHMFDKNGIEIDYETAKIIAEQNED